MIKTLHDLEAKVSSVVQRVDAMATSSSPPLPPPPPLRDGPTPVGRTVAPTTNAAPLPSASPSPPSSVPVQPSASSSVVLATAVTKAAVAVPPSAPRTASDPRDRSRTDYVAGRDEYTGYKLDDEIRADAMLRKRYMDQVDSTKRLASELSRGLLAKRAKPCVRRFHGFYLCPFCKTPRLTAQAASVHHLENDGAACRAVLYGMVDAMYGAAIDDVYRSGGNARAWDATVDAVQLLHYSDLSRNREMQTCSHCFCFVSGGVSEMGAHMRSRECRDAPQPFGHAFVPGILRPRCIPPAKQALEFARRVMRQEVRADDDTVVALHGLVVQFEALAKLKPFPSVDAINCKVAELQRSNTRVQLALFACLSVAPELLPRVAQCYAAIRVPLFASEMTEISQFEDSVYRVLCLGPAFVVKIPGGGLSSNFPIVEDDTVQRFVRAAQNPATAPDRAVCSQLAEQIQGVMRDQHSAVHHAFLTQQQLSSSSSSSSSVQSSPVARGAESTGIPPGGRVAVRTAESTGIPPGTGATDPTTKAAKTATLARVTCPRAKLRQRRRWQQQRDEPPREKSTETSDTE